MNVVYLHCHDAGRVLAPYGYEVPSPQLLAFARGATVFRQAFCCGPTCSPSRAALLTGRTAHESGMLGLVHRGFRLRDTGWHLGQQLRGRGYLTALAGVQHELQAEEISLVYERVFPEKANHLALAEDRQVAEWAAGFVRERHDRPFFLACGFFFPHREFPAIGTEAAHRGPLPPGLPDDPRVRRDYAAYQEGVRLMDEAAGIVLRALAESGRDRDTLVIFTTDHGIPFPEMKCSLSDAGIGVALMIRPPEGMPHVASSSALVSHLDVVPTVWDYLGRPLPAGLGRSLRGLIEGREDRLHEAVFAEINFHCAYEPARCIRTERHKLIRYFTPDRGPRPSNVDDSPAKQVWIEGGALQRPRELCQLYDLAVDPHERRNLADDPQWREVRCGLEERLRQWMEQTRDPLLHGDVPRPPGAKVNVPDSLHPAAGPFEPVLPVAVP